MWPWWVKIPSEDFTDETPGINDTYGGYVRDMVVLIMEVDKVGDEGTDNRHGDWQVDWYGDEYN